MSSARNREEFPPRWLKIAFSLTVLGIWAVYMTTPFWAPTVKTPDGIVVPFTTVLGIVLASAVATAVKHSRKGDDEE